MEAGVPGRNQGEEWRLEGLAGARSHRVCRPQEVCVVVGGDWRTGLYSVSSKVLGDKMPNRLSNAWSLKKLAPLLASRIWVRYA